MHPGGSNLEWRDAKTGIFAYGGGIGIENEYKYE